VTGSIWRVTGRPRIKSGRPLPDRAGEMNHDQSHNEMRPVFNEDGMFAYRECDQYG
jgi:hypothetical protein